jgi:hypothetical protein
VYESGRVTFYFTIFIFLEFEFFVVKETAGMGRRKIEIAATTDGLDRENIKMTMTKRRRMRQK